MKGCQGAGGLRECGEGLNTGNPASQAGGRQGPQLCHVCNRPSLTAQHSAAGGPAAGGMQPALSTHLGRASPAAAGWTQAACPTGGAAGPAGSSSQVDWRAQLLCSLHPIRLCGGRTAPVQALAWAPADRQQPPSAQPPPHLDSQGGVPQLRLPSRPRASQRHHAPLPVCGAAAGAAAGQERGRLLHVPAQR